MGAGSAQADFARKTALYDLLHQHAADVSASDDPDLVEHSSLLSAIAGTTAGQAAARGVREILLCEKKYENRTAT
jgi:hypothetical protein